MFGLVRTEARSSLLVDRVPLRDQGVKCTRHGHDIVAYEEIGDKVVILNHLALLVTCILGQQAPTGEGHPLHKQIEGLAFISRGLNRPPQLNAGDVFEQEDRPDNAT